MMAKCGRNKKDNHICEKLHNVIGKQGKRLNVKVTTTPLWIRTSRKRLAQQLVQYPVLLVSDWIDCIFQYGGHFFLGGRSLDDLETFQQDLWQFWENYEVIDPSFFFFSSVSRDEWVWSVPLAIHGDEGRGKAKQPVMVASVQCLLPLKGKQHNMQGLRG